MINKNNGLASPGFLSCSFHLHPLYVMTLISTGIHVLPELTAHSISSSSVLHQWHFLTTPSTLPLVSPQFSYYS